MFPATLTHRAFSRVESHLPPMLHFVAFRMGESLPFARIGTRRYWTHAEGIEALRAWYPGCMIYAYEPGQREKNGVIVN